MPTVTVTRDANKRRLAVTIPGCHWDAEAREFRIDTDSAAPASMALVRKHFPEASLPEAAASGGGNLRPLDLATKWAGKRSAASLLPNMPAELRERLYRYQQVDLAYLVERMKQDGGAYCGWSRGLGKTFGAIAAALELGARKWVVVCPNSSKEAVWRPEVEKWAPGRWPVFNVHGTAKQRDRTLEAFARSSDGVLLVHYEGLRLVKWEKHKDIDLVVCDEAHRLAKGSSSGKAPQFYKALKKVKAKYRLALSGSIVVNTPEDLFGALHWLMPDVYKSKWRDWNNRFLHYIQGPWGAEFMGIRAGMLEPMQTELGGLLVVRRKEDELPDLPDRIDQTIEVELSKEQRRVYDDLAERFIAELPDGEQIIAPSVLAQLTKLRQIATGLDLLGEEFNDSTKIDLAEEMIKDNLPNKTVVFAWHRATVYAIEQRMEKAGIPVRAITGDVKERDRAAYVKEFQNDPDVKVIVATIKTLGEAVTLHAASDLIFVESSWTPTDMEQAADRVYRIGQVNHVSITHIVAKDTVDVLRMMPVVKSKDEMRRLVLGGAL
jgi:SNF2 family DNA or RNA helicase